MKSTTLLFAQNSIIEIDELMFDVQNINQTFWFFF